MRFLFLILIGFIVIVLLNPVGVAILLLDKFATIASYIIITYVVIALFDL